MKSILAALRIAGLGEGLLYTADGGNELQAGTLPEIHAVVNFDPGEAKEEFAYWDGWFDHGGEKLVGPTPIDRRKNGIGS